MWYLVFSTNHCFISIVCLYCLLPGPTTGVLTLDLSQVNTTACLRLERSVSQKHFYIALAQLSSNLMSQRVLTFTRLGLCLATKQMTYCNCYLCTCCFYVWLIAFGFFFNLLPTASCFGDEPFGDVGRLGSCDCRGHEPGAEHLQSPRHLQSLLRLQHLSTQEKRTWRYSQETRESLCVFCL